MTVRYNPDYQGTGQLMRSPEMVALMRQVAEDGAEYARSISPVGTKGDRHPGEYKASFEVTVTDRGGPHNDRAEARIVNTSDHAVNVEWQDGYHILTRTAAHLGTL